MEKNLPMVKLAHLKIYSELFEEIYTENNNKLIIHIKNILSPDMGHIVDVFYYEMNSRSETKKFLPIEQIENRLKPALSFWLEDIFSPKQLTFFEEYIQRQIKIGQVHARIKLSMTLVSFGVELLKGEISSRISQSALLIIERERALILINKIIDLTTMVVNEVHFLSQLESEKISQSLNLHFISQDFAIECEQARADLLHWFQELTTTLCFSQNRNSYFPFLSIWKSSFGLWVIHRAPLYYQGLMNVEAFNHLLSEVEDKVTESVNNYRAEKQAQLAENINELSVLIKQIDWLLERLSKEIKTIEKSKDPLTLLMTRRYIPTVIQHEIRFCLTNDSHFAVLLIDIDHFKKINDSYGHAIGDAVLGEVAELLTSMVRVSDHLFRYGGEEFLILISDVDFKQAMDIAEHIRFLIEKHIFLTIPGFNEMITISLGCSLFYGHPDYEQLINQADQALYIAKNSGRNKVEMFNYEASYQI